jgi:hypothetical protein
VRRELHSRTVTTMPRRAVKCGKVFAVKEQPCLYDGVTKVPVSLPVVVIHGESCVAFNQSAPWIGLALEGKTRMEHTALISDFLDASIRTLPPLIATDGDSPGADDMDTKGRSALGLDDDTDEEDLHDGAAGAGGKKRRLRLPTEFIETVVDGVTFRARRRQKGPGMLVSVQGPGLTDILQYMYVKLQAGDASDIKHKRVVDAERKRARAALDDVDKGRINWSFRAMPGWAIHYVEKDGQAKSITKGYTVPRADFDGRLFAAAEYAIRRQAVLLRARACWDSVDCSDMKRYTPHSEDSDVIGVVSAV